MRSIQNNIYPMTPENLKALLEFYFPVYYSGNVKRFYKALKAVGISLRELEFVAESIQQFIPYIEKSLGHPPSQVNILMYGLEAFVDEYWDFTVISIERSNLVYQIRKRAGIPTIEVLPQLSIDFENQMAIV